jgi:hypothetical protein
LITIPTKPDLALPCSRDSTPSSASSSAKPDEFIFGPFHHPAFLNPVRAPAPSAVLLPQEAESMALAARLVVVFQTDADDKCPQLLWPVVQISRPGSVVRGAGASGPFEDAVVVVVVVAVAIVLSAAERAVVAAVAAAGIAAAHGHGPIVAALLCAAEPAVVAVAVAIVLSAAEPAVVAAVVAAAGFAAAHGRGRMVVAALCAAEPAASAVDQVVFAVASADLAGHPDGRT